MISTKAEDENVIHRVSETLDNIFRLSRAIRRSGALRGYANIGSHSRLDENSLNSTPRFRSYAQRLINSHMKDCNASEALRQRIFDTVCSRQQYFSSLKARRGKIMPLEKLKQSESSSPTSAVAITDSSTSTAARKETKKSHQGYDPFPSRAAEDQPLRVQSARSFKSDNVTTGRYVSLGDADIPRPPIIPTDVEGAECPYCFLACSKEELSGTRWKCVFPFYATGNILLTIPLLSRERKHIIQDLVPFVCVLEHCPNPGSLFESDKDWFNHMRNQHATGAWLCVDSTHSTTLHYQSKAEFKYHLIMNHSGFFEEDQIENIAAQCYQEIPNDVVIKECPFCPTGEHLEREPGDMITHIAGHLISLAKISLFGHIDEELLQPWSKQTVASPKRDSTSRSDSTYSPPVSLPKTQESDNIAAAMFEREPSNAQAELNWLENRKPQEGSQQEVPSDNPSYTPSWMRSLRHYKNLHQAAEDTAPQGTGATTGATKKATS